MKVLIACEFSGIVREAFRERGCNAYSCDFLPSEIPGAHIQDDVMNHLEDGWDMMIAFPPCTYLCNSGVRWLYEKGGRFEKMRDSALFVRKLYSAPIKKIAIENPIPHHFALSIIGKYDQIIQPFQFGESTTKATCLWLKGLPRLIPTKIVKPTEHRCWLEPPSEHRWKNRSRTLLGIAKAMAEQWSSANDLLKWTTDWATHK